MVKKLNLIALTLTLVVVLIFSSVAYAVEQPNLQNTDEMYLKAVKKYSFDITVPRFGSAYTDSEYTMTAGKYLRVHLETSGGKSVAFTAVDAKTKKPLMDDPVVIKPGKTKTVYTNTSGETQKIKIRLSSSAVVEVEATGEFIFGEF